MEDEEKDRQRSEVNKKAYINIELRRESNVRISNVAYDRDGNRTESSYLKNTMRLEGYNIPIAVQRMSEDNIEELELFGKTEMLKYIS